MTPIQNSLVLATWLLWTTLGFLGHSAASPLPRFRSVSQFKRNSLPAQDPFYTPPAGYQNTAPGTVLRNRTVQGAFAGTVPLAGVTTYQLLYRTNDALNNPIATVTTLFKPVAADGTKLVGYASAEDSDSTSCDPSYNYVLGDQQTDGIVEFEELLIDGAIAEGWIVSSPDYEGPTASFSPGW